MDYSEFYMSLPYDISGSRSKNRFRVELLWGINKMIDMCCEDNSDFAMVFDYVCDIELHMNDRFEFYQIKSHKGTKSYNINNLTRIDKESLNSILGKLYMIKSSNIAEHKMKLAIVSNAFLKCNEKTYSDYGTVPFATIGQKSLDKIQEALKTELNIDFFNCNDIYYICTPINLEEPENDVKGKLIGAFEKIEGCEPKKPNALWNLIFNTVEEKACCEKNQSDYIALVANKGITKSEFKKMLDCHRESANDGVKVTKEYIDNIGDFKKRRKLNLALNKIVPESSKSIALQKIEKLISEHIVTHEEDLPDNFDEAVDYLNGFFASNFPIEYSADEKTVFCILILKRFEEGMYK